MNTIKFSHVYDKMPFPQIDEFSTHLFEVLIAKTEELHNDFINYDTIYGYDTIKQNYLKYPLPKGKVLILLLKSGDHLWTTIRRWTQQKEKYYKGLRGQEVKIEVNEH